MLSTARRTARLLVNYWRGGRFASSIAANHADIDAEHSPSPLETYFDQLHEGPGIYKWRHYFSIYHCHLARFIGKPITLMEVGIYSGGSLQMWRSYLGPQSRIVGIDIEPACLQYERDGVRVLIGDQVDRAFWAKTRSEVPTVDVVIDDGGHAPEQQMVTIEEMLPHIRPGGVFICEDVHGNPHGLISFLAGLQAALHHTDFDGQNGSKASDFQNSIASIHVYPFVIVIEKSATPQERFVTERHGTQWQPFSP